MNERTSTTFKVTLAPRAAEQLIELAKDEGITTSQLIRYLILHALHRTNTGDAPW